MSAPAPRPWLAVTISALIVFSVLVSLGLWQLERLEWKETLLAHIDARIHAAPIDLPPAAQWAQWPVDDYDYRHVKISGVFDHGKEIRLFASAGHIGAEVAQPGYYIITPFRLDDGHLILVNRGFVPLDYELPHSRPQSLVEGRQTLTGLLRGPEARNLFSPADEPQKRLWFTRDPQSIATALGLDQLAPFSLDVDRGPDPNLLPVGGTTLIALPNNHLGYALTWFGLAATLVGVYAVFMWRRFAKSSRL